MSNFSIKKQNKKSVIARLQALILSFIIIIASFGQSFSLLAEETELLPLEETSALLLSDETKHYYLQDVDGFSTQQLNLYSLYALVRSSGTYGSIDYLRLGADEKIQLGSITQLMTYYIIREKLLAEDIDLEDRIILTQEDFDYAEELQTNVAGFLLGDSPTVNDLLHAMVLRAAGEAIHALVRSTYETESRFVSQMNAKASVLNMENTHYTDPLGRESDSSYTSLDDMGKLMDVLLDDNLFKEMMGKDSYTTSSLQSNPEGFLFYSIMYSYADQRQLDTSQIGGGKTGSTTRSGFSYISFNEVGESDFLIITAKALQDGQELADHIKIRERMQNLPYQFPMLSKETAIEERSLLDQEGNTIANIPLFPAENYALRLPLWSDLGAYSFALNTEEPIQYPLSSEQALEVRILEESNFSVSTIDTVALHLDEELIESILASTAEEEKNTEEAKETEKSLESSTADEQATAEVSDENTDEASNQTRDEVASTQVGNFSEHASNTRTSITGQSQSEQDDEKNSQGGNSLSTILRTVLIVVAILAMLLVFIQILGARKRKARRSSQEKRKRMEEIRRKYKK